MTSSLAGMNKTNRGQVTNSKLNSAPALQLGFWNELNEV